MLFHFFINIFPSANFTKRYMQSGCFFDSLFITWIIIKKHSPTATIQKLYSLFLGWHVIAQYRNNDKCCEETLQQDKDIRKSQNLRRVGAIYKTNKLVLSKKYISLKTKTSEKVLYSKSSWSRLIFFNQLILNTLCF